MGRATKAKQICLREHVTYRKKQKEKTNYGTQGTDFKP